MCKEGVDVGVVYVILFLTARGVHSHSFAAGNAMSSAFAYVQPYDQSHRTPSSCLSGRGMAQSGLILKPQFSGDPEYQVQI